jgi:hypothetical protein
VRLLQAHQQAQDDARLGYEFRGISNRQLATRVELFRKIVADRLDGWTDREIDDAVAKLQGERRRRKRNAKAPQAEAAEPSAQPEEKIGEDENAMELKKRIDFNDVTSP